MTCCAGKKRGWVCRQSSLLGLAAFLGVGLYGAVHYLFGPPPPRLTLYMGNVTTLFPSPGPTRGQEPLEVGEVVPNCGLAPVCPPHHFPVHIYTGLTKDDRPRVCISGKYIIDKATNGAGRGLNLVVVEPVVMRPLLVRRFDTYASESASKELELFLSQDVRQGDILVAVTFDEASRNLGQAAKNMLAELGSSQIQNLQFRGQWFMVTQRGLKGFSPYEDLKASRAGLWNPIDLKFCVPGQLQGRFIMPDPPVHVNSDRIKFCASRPHITDFCSVHHRESPLRPAILTNIQFIGSPVFTTPIMVLAGEGGPSSLSDLALTLQTLLAQPGIQNRYVIVVYDPTKIPDVPALCRLFQFGSKAVTRKRNATLDYWELVGVAFESGRAVFPGSPYITLLEAGLLLAPDFLAYTASLLPLLQDTTLLAISAWNPNGYPSVSTRPDLAYRTEDFPGLAFTLRMATYTKELRHNLKECCNRRGWEGWLGLARWDREVVVPDVSRVLRLPQGSDLLATPLGRALFGRLRATNLEMSSAIQNGESLSGQRYEAHLAGLLNTSTTITTTRPQVLQCAQDGDPSHLLQHLNLTSDSVVAVLPYREEDITGFAGMKLLCRCFGLFHQEDAPPRGLHRGLLRFSMKGSQVVLLSSASPHYQVARYTAVTLTLP